MIDKYMSLQEQYEDALFALLMADAAAAENLAVQEEMDMLKADPASGVPKAADERCRQTIRRYLVQEKARKVGHFTFKIVKNVLVAVGTAALLFTVALAASETVRLDTMNLFIEVFRESTDYHFVGSIENFEPLQLQVGWVPGGYTQTERGRDSNEVWNYYKNAKGDMIYISCCSTDGMVASFDTEDAKVEYVDIQGNSAMMIEKCGFDLAWAAKNNSMLLDIHGEALTREEIIRIANELIY